MQDVKLRSSFGPVVEARKAPIGHVNVTATSAATAQDLFTVRDNVAFQVKRLAVCNTTGTAATLTLHTVPSGGTIGAGNAEMVGYSVAANAAVDLTDLIQGFYEQGTTAKVFSGTSGALTVHGWGDEVL